MLGTFAPVRATYSDAFNWGYGSICGYDWTVGSFLLEEKLFLKQIMGHHHHDSDSGMIQQHIDVKEMWAVYEVGTHLV